MTPLPDQVLLNFVEINDFSIIRLLGRHRPVATTTLNTAGNGVVVPPFGLFGATDGFPHHYVIVSNRAERVSGSKEAGVASPGDHIICLSSEGRLRSPGRPG